MSLLDGLLAYWKLDEGSGDALDAHGAYDLDEGDTGTTTGKLSGARSFDGTAFLQDIDPFPLEAELHGDIPLTLAGWFWIDDEPQENTDQTILSRWIAASTWRSFSFWYDYSENRLKWTVSGNGTAGTTVTASNYGAPPTGEWVRFKLWHDPVANVIGIQLDNTTANTAAHSAGIAEGVPNTFQLGAGPTGDNVTDIGLVGRLDEVGIWTRVWDSQDSDDHWNSGAGLNYDNFEPFAGTASLKLASQEVAPVPPFAGTASLKLAGQNTATLGTASLLLASEEIPNPNLFAGTVSLKLSGQNTHILGTSSLKLAAEEIPNPNLFAGTASLTLAARDVHTLGTASLKLASQEVAPVPPFAGTASLKLAGQNTATLGTASLLLAARELLGGGGRLINGRLINGRLIG